VVPNVVSVFCVCAASSGPNSPTPLFPCSSLVLRRDEVYSVYWEFCNDSEMPKPGSALAKQACLRMGAKLKEVLPNLFVKSSSRRPGQRQTEHAWKFLPPAIVQAELVALNAWDAVPPATPARANAAGQA